MNEAGPATGTQAHDRVRAGGRGRAIDYADRNASVLVSGGGRSLNPTSSASSSTATSRSGGTRASSARSGRTATRWRSGATGDRRPASGARRSSRCGLYNDVTFIDEVPHAGVRHREQVRSHHTGGRTATTASEIDSRASSRPKDKLLFRLTNFGNLHLRRRRQPREPRRAPPPARPPGRRPRPREVRETLRCLFRVGSAPAPSSRSSTAAATSSATTARDHTTRPTHAK